MRVPLGHAGGGGFDELLFLLAFIVLAWGYVVLADREKHPRRRWMAVPVFAIGAGIAAVPIVLQIRQPGTAKIRIASTARVQVLAPAPGSAVRGSTMLVEVRLDGARIVQTTTTKLRPDRGHMHLSIDGRSMRMDGLRAVFDVAWLEPGRHLVSAEFVATDHGPFAPPVVAVSSFTMEGS